MDIKVLPSKLSGSVSVPESKSVAHRVIIASAISIFQKENPSASDTLLNTLEENLVNPSDDILATLDCCKSLTNHTYSANCRNSGTTLRLLLPVFAALSDKFDLSVGSQLSQRPVNTLTDILAEGGCQVTYSDLSFHGNGLFNGGKYSLAGNISSQYISGLLFALPLTKEGGTIEITTELQSRPYVDLTLKVLKDFGIEIVETIDNTGAFPLSTFEVPGNQKYIYPCKHDYTLEKDWSSAAFWYTSNFTGNFINVENMNYSSLQGDKKIIEILQEYKSGGDITVDVQHIPDLVPILAVAASFRKLGSKVFFTNTQRLKIKESDRQMSTLNMIQSLGGSGYLTDQGFCIEGVEILPGGIVETYQDHRIAMSASIAGLSSKHGVVIKNYKCVEKSYPDFFEHLIQLGGQIAKL